MIVPILPEFRIDGKLYVLLYDIQCVFNIREDYALAAIAKFYKEEEGFVSEDSSLDEALELNFDHRECLQICFNKAKSYKEQGFALDEENFKKCQQEYGFDVLKDSSEAILKKRENYTKEGSVNLWTDNKLVPDETSHDFLEELDTFLRRGNRDYHGRDGALSHYLKDLSRARILIFHNSMSQQGIAANFLFKTLSRFLGASVIPKTYEKIILIEKVCAIDIFGYWPGQRSSRRSYFNTYTGHALSLGVENPDELEEYGKHFLLRYKQKPKVDNKTLLKDE